MAVNPVPKGLHTLTPQIVVEGAEEAISLYKKAFGAELVSKALDPNGTKVWHAELRIGDSTFYLNDTIPEMGGKSQSASLWLYSPRADELFEKAVEAGCTAEMPMQDQFWGDRTGTVADKWGNRWNIAKHLKDMSEAEMKRASEEFAKSQEQQKKS